MNTQTDLRSILQLIGGCLLCLGLAALGFYPFAGRHGRKGHLQTAFARRGFRAWII